MFTDTYLADVVVTTGSALQNSFVKVSANGNTSVRKNFDAGDGEPKVLRISHQDVGSGATARTRSMVRLEAYPLDADGNEDNTQVCALYAVLDKPKQGVSSENLALLFKQFIGLLYGGSGDAAYDYNVDNFVTKWSRGES